MDNGRDLEWWGNQADMSLLSFWTVNEPVEIPVPASFGLLAVGMALLVFVLRRNRSLE